MKHWTSEETRILQENYGKASRDTLEKLLPHRSWKAISNKASRIKGRKFRPITSFIKPQRIGILSHDNVLYLAGLYDGEGSFTLNRKKGRIYGFEANVKIVLTHKETMEWLSMKLNIPFKKKNLGPGQRSRKWKTAYGLSLGRVLDIKTFVRQILPYLKIKKRQAELVLRFCNLQLERKWSETPQEVKEIYQELKQLNTKGVHSLNG